MAPRVQHKRSAVAGKAPQPSDLEYGEIGVNYEASDPALYVKDSANAIRKISPQVDATTSAKGVVQLATGAEVTTGTDAVKAITPATLKTELDKKANQATTYTKAETDTALALKANLVSPALTGTPTAPTAAAGTNTTQLATTAFVAAATPDATEAVKGLVELATAAETTTGTDATRAVHPAGLKVELDKKANLASPALTGTPTAPTAAAGTNTTQLATTAFVAAAQNWTRTGTVVSPTNAGDQVHTGTGKLTVGGTAAAPAVSLDPGSTGSPLVRDSNGRVGIGSTAPSEKLVVNESAASVAMLLRTGGATLNAAIKFNADDTNYAGVGLENTALVFRCSNSATPVERMRILNNGSIFCYGEDGLTTRTSFAAGTGKILFQGLHSAAGVLTGGTQSFVVTANGDAKNANNSWMAISDIKLKENIVDARSQWDDIKALHVVNYNFKPETNHETHKQLGLIAQEVEQVCPGLVGETPDRDAEGNDLGTVTKSVNYSVLYMKAVKALQEAIERIEALEAQVAALAPGGLPEG